MFKKIEPTLLGDILVSKALITPTQRDIALAEQARRKRLLDPTDPSAPVTPLGEILIELGFIDQLQLKRGLNWQQRLRHASIAMALCAPFMIFSPSAAANVVRPAPITVEAENYTAMSGVQSETTADVGGGRNIGYIDSSDWMTFRNITIPATGTYKITYRVASLNGGGSMVLKNESTDQTLDTVSIPKTAGWQTWVDVERTLNLAQGALNLKLFATSGGFNLNWFKLESIDGTPIASSSSSSASSVSVAGETQFPFVIRAASYSTMSGVQKEATTDVGGGQNVGYIDTGDWMSYDNSVINAPFTGKYRISYRVASTKNSAVLALKNITTGATIDSVPIPNTGGWQAWTTVEREIALEAGEHKFKLDATTGGFNVNWVRIEPIATPMPLTIEAETYSEMSGVKNETASGDGGGTNVGYIDTGDWMDYKNVEVLIPATASYKVTYRVASLSAGGSFTFHEAGTSTVFDRVSVPVTGGWQKWASVEKIINLPAGRHYFGIKALLGGFNVNWIKVEPVDPLNNPVNLPPSTISTSSSSSQAAASSSSSSKPATSSSSWSAASSSGNTQQVAGPVGISWTAPNKRENGDYLDITELGGYEIRYKKLSDAKFTYISINDAWTSSYSFPWLEGEYVFQIAAFDKNGVYSPFVDILRQK